MFFHSITISGGRRLKKGFQSGFSLIELIVALGLFMVVMTVAVGALTTMNNTAKKTEAIHNVTDNINFAVENMTRRLRMGTYYHCGSSGVLTLPQDCAATGSNFISFVDQYNRQSVYRLNGTSIERSLDGGVTYLSVTAPEVVVSSLTFYVSGTSLADSQQPHILMIVRGQAGVNSKSISTFNLQSFVTQRLLDS